MIPLAVVTGGRGTIGPDLVAGLVGAGWKVRTYSRSASNASRADASVEHVVGDVRDVTTLSSAMDGAQTVFHLAAALDDPGAHTGKHHEMHAVNVEGTAVAIRAAEAAGVRRFVHFSTINVYGPTRGGPPANEATAPAPETEYGRSKLAAEQVVLASPVASVVLRPAAVYGPRVRGGYWALVRAIRGGYFATVGDGRNRRTLVFVDDLVRAALAAAERPDAVGQTLNVTDGAIHTLRDIVAAIAAASGRPVPTASVPEGLVRGVARGMGVLPVIGAIGRRIERAADKLTEDVAVVGERTIAVLDVRPSVSLHEGWRRVLCEMNR